MTKTINDNTWYFNYLRQFIGSDLKIIESDGHYEVRTLDNEIVLTSNPALIPYCDEDKLAPHVGDSIVCVYYGEEDEIWNISIECEDCYEVLFSVDAVEED